MPSAAINSSSPSQYSRKWTLSFHAMSPFRLQFSFSPHASPAPLYSGSSHTRRLHRVSSIPASSVIRFSMSIKNPFVVSHILRSLAGDGFLRSMNWSSNAENKSISSLVQSFHSIFRASQSITFPRLLFLTKASHSFPIIEPKNTCRIQSSKDSPFPLHPPNASFEKPVTEKLAFFNFSVSATSLSSEEIYFSQFPPARRSLFFSATSCNSFSKSLSSLKTSLFINVIMAS